MNNIILPLLIYFLAYTNMSWATEATLQHLSSQLEQLSSELEQLSSEAKALVINLKKGLQIELLENLKNNKGLNTKYKKRMKKELKKDMSEFNDSIKNINISKLKALQSYLEYFFAYKKSDKDFFDWVIALLAEEKLVELKLEELTDKTDKSAEFLRLDHKKSKIAKIANLTSLSTNSNNLAILHKMYKEDTQNLKALISEI